MKKRREKKSLIAPDLTPLIDVVFLLLIFFMVVTNFNKYSNFNLKLPESGIKSEEVKNNYELIIDGNGKYFLKENKKEIPITLENLGERLQGVKKISISADKNLKYEVIVKAIGKIKSLGINDVGLNFYE